MSGSESQVTGVILAGGQSRRMGGGDKGLLELAGRPMLAHVIERLAPAGGPPRHQRQRRSGAVRGFGLPVVADTIADFAGPLAGVLAGMRWSRANTPAARWIATAAGDAPLLPTRPGGALPPGARGIGRAASRSPSRAASCIP